MRGPAHSAQELEFALILFPVRVVFVLLEDSTVICNLSGAYCMVKYGRTDRRGHQPDYWLLSHAAPL